VLIQSDQYLFLNSIQVEPAPISPPTFVCGVVVEVQKEARRLILRALTINNLVRQKKKDNQQLEMLKS
jgi:hypothetical protein